MLCVPFCPDSAIPVKDGKRLDFDYMHCKGCGICENVCPFPAITMVLEVSQMKSRLSGNEAVAYAMKQINPDVMGAFPITPSTEIPEYFAIMWPTAR
jgi:ferredoxin